MVDLNVSSMTTLYLAKGIKIDWFWLFYGKLLLFLTKVGEYSSFDSAYLLRFAKELVL
jgi:hypothetical protein